MNIVTQNLLIEKKSKFYSYLFNVNNEEEIKRILLEVKSENKKATHICYAYRLKFPFSEKAFDDGEPSGTAGKPILMVMQKKDIFNCLIVVIRYFGGIKLGAGGLIRAYTKASSMLF